MPEFNASNVLNEAKERGEQLERGDKLVPVAAAVIAVFAALATLFANHSSISALAEKNEAILHQTRSADQYAYYESSRIKAHVYQAFLDSGLVATAASRKSLQSTANDEQAKAKGILKAATAEESAANEHSLGSERFMRSYESYEVAATLFEVSIVLVSITALMQTRVLLVVGILGSLAGLVFLVRGFLI